MDSKTILELHKITKRRLAILAEEAQYVMRAPRDADWREQVEKIRDEIRSLGVER